MLTSPDTPLTLGLRDIQRTAAGLLAALAATPPPPAAPPPGIPASDYYRLPPMQRTLADALCRAPGNVLAADHLLALLGHHAGAQTTRRLTAHTIRLRRALAPHGDLVTVRAQGYRWQPR